MFLVSGALPYGRARDRVSAGGFVMKTMVRVALVMALMVASSAGTWLVAQNSYGTPKTIIHVSVIKWKDGVPAADKKKVLDGVKDMAAKIPGMKNVWTKAIRVQPEGYTDAFVIEFENQAAADRYAKDPSHDAWTEAFGKIREATYSPQITNE
jgi:stress responsive alpha/beta barrel protein